MNTEIKNQRRKAAQHGGPKWKCPHCAGTDVQVSLPTWYTEAEDGHLVMVETDVEADVQCWYCEDCNDGGSGEPDRVNP